MATFIKPGVKPSFGNNSKTQGKGQVKEPIKRLTLEERKQKTYPFDDDDVQGIFDVLHSCVSP